MELKIYENSKNYTCQVVVIKNIRKHSNADKLLCTTIQGNNIICGLDTKVDNLYLFFPLESQLSESFSKSNDLIRRKDETGKTVGGMFEENRRVRAIKLRGEKSEGFIIPIESLSKLNIDFSKLKEGDEFNSIDGIEICKKYIVRKQFENSTKEKGKAKKAKVHSKLVDNQFRLHYDTSPFKKNIHMFKKEDIVSITQKMHGTSVVLSNLLCKRKLSLSEKILKFMNVSIIDSKYDYLYSSRKVIKNLDLNVTNYYSEDIWGYIFNKHKESIEKGISIYGEIVGQLSNGQDIQKGYTYGLSPKTCELYVYRITFTNEDGVVLEFNWQQVKNYCEKYFLKTVPELFYGRISEKFQYENEDGFLKELSETYLEKMLLENVPDEGVCIRNESKDFIAYKLKSFLFFEHETKELDKQQENIEEEV